MTLGEIINQYRKAHSISMADFAKLSGLSKAYIGILEKNVNPTTGKEVVPSIATIKAVSVAIGIEMNTLLEKLDSQSEIALAPTILEFNIESQELCDEQGEKEVFIQHQLHSLDENLKKLEIETVKKIFSQFNDIIAPHLRIIELIDAEERRITDSDRR